MSNALWWTIVTLTTVCYGDITPVTIGGRIIGAITMIGGIGLLGILTASIASVMVSAKLEGLRGMRTVNCTNHFGICGWSYKVRDIIEELRADAAEQSPIVLIADLPDKPIELAEFFFVRGEVTQNTIEQANLGQAQVVIVLGDENLDAFSRDARTILTTLTIKSAFPNLYTCVEIVEAKNATHGKLAGADELIISGALTTNLLVRAALDHGVTEVVTELLTAHGHELYLTPVPPGVVGWVYIEALQLIKTQHDALIVAVQNQQGELITNPAADYPLNKQDQLYLIAEHRPSF
jgi:voltage-gated potassium channel